MAWRSRRTKGPEMCEGKEGERGGGRQVAERKRGERCNEGDREVNSHAETELS